MIKLDKEASEVLSQRETDALLILAQQGNKLAKNKLIQHNFRFVAGIVSSIIKNYNSNIFDDLIQEGIFGLDKAIDNFDTSKKIKFTTYAVWWVRHYVTKYYRENLSIIRLPDNISQFLLTKAKRKNDSFELVQTIGGDYVAKVPESTPSASSLTKALNLKRVEETALGTDIFELLKASEEEDDEEVVSSNKLDMSSLSDREKSMLLDRFFAGYDNYRDLGSAYKMSHERARQIVNKALKKLRESNEEK